MPRISIHAFCEFPDTGAALQRAGADRRLSKAHLQVQLGGINAAVEHYRRPDHAQSADRRNPAAAARQALDELDRLADVCDPATKVIVVGRVNDVELYRELMRRGASEYLVAPVEPAAADRSDFRPLSRSRTRRRSAAWWPWSARAAARAPRRWRTMSAGASPRNCTSTPPSSISICRSAPWAWTSTTKPARASPMRLSAPERLDDVLLDRLLLKRGDHLSLFTAPAALERDYDAGARIL